MVVVKITLSDIFKYIGDRIRSMSEGEAVFSTREIFSLALKTSPLNTEPHEINLILNGSVDNWKCECSCKAGQSGFCKHIIATLIYINHHEDIEEFTCTFVSQVWGKEKGAVKKLYEAQSTEEFYHRSTKDFKSPVYSYTTSKELDDTNFKMLVDCNELSAIHKFLTRANEQRNEGSMKKRRLYSLLLYGVSVSAIEAEELHLFYFVVLVCLFLFLLQINNGSKTSFQIFFEKILANANLSFLNIMTLPEYPLQDCCHSVLQELKCDSIDFISQISQGSSQWKSLRQLRITGSSTVVE